MDKEVSKALRILPLDEKIYGIQKHIAKLNKQLELLTLQRIKILNDDTPVEQRFTHRPTEKYVVAAVELRPLIKEWIDKGNTLVALARESELSERTLRHILTIDEKFVYASNADKLLVALNATHIQLTEVPNPKLLPNDISPCDP